MMARNSLMVRQRLHSILRPGLRPKGVHIEIARPRTIVRRRVIVCFWSSLRPELLNLSKAVLGFRQATEKLGKSLVHLLQNTLETSYQRLAVRIVHLSISS